MIKLRPGGERGYFDHGWLKTYHSFSFDEYHDPAHMHFRTLRVINEDAVAPGKGFATHSHRDMEIVTYILSGELQHKDSMGNTSVIRPGEVQRMTAGTGVTHSEFNPSPKEPVHLLQIWILPGQKGLAPGYEQKALGRTTEPLRLIASPKGGEEGVRIHQDAYIYEGRLEQGGSARHVPKPGRGAWVQVTDGSVKVQGESLREGDGCRIEAEKSVSLVSSAGCRFLLFDLA